jgi:uncharacterized membrane protein YbhN (UPF0104 family)
VSVEVVEPRIADRVRRGADLYWLVMYAALAFLAISLGNLAVGTAGALEQDLAGATSGVPRLILALMAWVSGTGVLLLPIAVGIDLVVRQRAWQFVQSLVGAAIAAGIGLAIKAAISEGQLTTALAVLTRPVRSSGRTNPLDIVVVALTALVVVANISGRRWLVPLASLVLGSMSVTTFLAGSNTALALLCSFLLGAIVGHAVRFAFGTSATRAPGTDVARELILAGTPLHTLVLVDDYDEGARLYHARGPQGPLDVHVFDRDTFGLASGRRLLSRLRLRGATTRAPSFTLRGAVEHRALQAFSLQWAGVTAPVPVAICDVGGVSAAIATTRVEGRTLREIGDGLTDEQARAVVQMLLTLQQHRIAFRGFSRDTVAILPDGKAGLVATGDGDVGSDDLSQRTDAARVMVMLALGMGAERAVQVAVQEAGAKFVSRTLPLLQPLALGRALRLELRSRKKLLDELREQVLTLAPAHEEPASIQLRRVSPKGLLTLVGGAVAAYIVLPQLVQVDFGAVLSRAEWHWGLAALASAVLTFAGASLVLHGSVPVRLRFVRTYLTQLAVAFSSLIAPATIGNIALNTRYLQRSGITPTAAGASVGLAQVFQFTSYATLLALASVVAGTGPQASFQPPAKVVAAIPIVLAVIAGLFAIPRVRAFFRERVLPQLRAVVPQILGVLQRPVKLAELLGGALLLDMSFVAALYFSCRAFGAQPAVAAVAVVYFAGAIIGSAVPTPGGLGGIEAAMSAGLTIAAGVDASTAFSAVLLYRIVTYWLPIPAGWFALQHLQSRDAI